jgi:ankyrin repeat protein
MAEPGDLIDAADAGDLEACRAILAAGDVGVNDDEDGHTALCCASESGHVPLVRMLIAEGAVVNKANNNGATALFLASQNGHLEVVTTLLKAGAEILQRDDGSTPLMAASAKGHAEVAKVLVAAKAGFSGFGLDPSAWLKKTESKDTEGGASASKSLLDMPVFEQAHGNDALSARVAAEALAASGEFFDPSSPLTGKRIFPLDRAKARAASSSPNH